MLLLPDLPKHTSCLQCYEDDGIIWTSHHLHSPFFDDVHLLTDVSLHIKCVVRYGRGAAKTQSLSSL